MHVRRYEYCLDRASHDFSKLADSPQSRLRSESPLSALHTRGPSSIRRPSGVTGVERKGSRDSAGVSDEAQVKSPAASAIKPIDAQLPFTDGLQRWPLCSGSAVQRVHHISQPASFWYRDNFCVPFQARILLFKLIEVDLVSGFSLSWSPFGFRSVTKTVLL